MKLKRCRGYAARVDDETVNEGMLFIHKLKGN